MKKLSLSLSLLLFSLFIATSAHAFEVSSTSIQHDKQMELKYTYNAFGCTGQNLSPQLSWKDAPAGTKSFAITAYDPDAPTGSGWWHWVVYNIPASAAEIAEGGKIEGAAEGKTDFGTAAYGGPCPPVGHGTHHYTFTVFALDVEKLEVPADATAAMVGYNLNGHKLATASIMATFERK